MCGEFAAVYAQALYQYRNLPAVAKFQEWAPESLEEVSQLISRQAETFLQEPGQHYQWGITLRTDPAILVGDFGVSLKVDQPQTVEFGIALDPDYQHQGIATEALWLLMDYLFKQQNIHRVIASVDPDNKSSMRLMQRLGMRNEAHHICNYWFNDEWVDDVVFALLTDEWPVLELESIKIRLVLGDESGEAARDTP